MNEAFEVPTVVSFAFWVASAITIAAAIMVVTVRDVFKAAVFLAGSFIGVSAIFFLLNAEFVGVVQILVYVGAVSILIAFSVMMISDVSHGSQPSRARYASVTVSALVLAAIAVTVYNTEWTLNSGLTDPDAIAGLSGTFIEDEIASGEGRVRDASGIQASDSQVVQTGVLGDSTGTVGALLVREFVLPFETVGLVIVAALIGGLALMRPREGEPDPRGGG
ncbi:MAG: NADH-quinone oxidoreductase subunit J [Chloroflexi bacterium]|nr:NADH-quinone oxidoreductase subunit J [Chloroflexota bacterium]MDA1296620.1 NADH-quinone oxidoreductase subunit J [Chloroflexota bacterium]